MTDIKSTIAELRYLADWAQHHLDKAKIANDAADAIEALQGEVARLKTSDLAEHNKRLIDNNAYLARRHDEAAGKLRLVEAERDALQAENERLKPVVEKWKDECHRVQALFEKETLRASELHEKVEQINAHRNHILASNDKLCAERDALAAKLDELQRQEPAGYVGAGYLALGEGRISEYATDVYKVPMYAAPNALEPTTWQPASNPPPESAGEVLVRMADGRCEIAWPTYWHGSSNAFSQWTFRDPDEDEQPVEWMTIPAHGITKGTP